MEAGPEERIDDDVIALGSLGLSDVETCLPQGARRDPAVAAVGATPADDGNPTGVGIRPQHLDRDRRPGALHELGRRRGEAWIPRLGGPHLLRRVQRLEHQP